MVEERLKLAVFVDFDNIQIGVKETLGKEFEVSLVLEALKERGEVMSKIAYGDWPKAGEYSRQMSQHAVHMVQRNVTPRGDKNGADINLALDALEMAFSRPYINAYVIVGGDSDFIALVEKLKQYDKRVFVVGGRAFTSNIMQRNCHEFISYENLLKAQESSRGPRASRGRGRTAIDTRPLSAALPNVQRALKILAEREVAPQVGLLKSTLLQLDPTFSERDYGSGTFLEFMQKMERAGLVQLRRTERGYLVEPASDREDSGSAATPIPVVEAVENAAVQAAASAEGAAGSGEAMELLRRALADAGQKAPSKPLYLRQISQALRPAGADYDSRRQGFRAILDLLHQAQREGLLRLHRDHKGTWRVFPLTASAATAPGVGPSEIGMPGPEASIESESAEVDVRWEEAVPAEEIAEEVVAAAVEAPLSAAEEAHRRPRGARSPSRARPEAQRAGRARAPHDARRRSRRRAASKAPPAWKSAVLASSRTPGGEPCIDDARGVADGFIQPCGDGGGHLVGKSRRVGDWDGQDVHLAGKRETKLAHDLANLPQADEVGRRACSFADGVQVALLNLRPDKLFRHVAVDYQDFFPVNQLIQQGQAETRGGAYFNFRRKTAFQLLGHANANRVVLEHLVAKTEDQNRRHCEISRIKLPAASRT